jgi:hypothetical protein
MTLSETPCRLRFVASPRRNASHNAIFLAHGYASNFNTDFMGGTHSPQSLPVYLASQGIDVWGSDYGWALVPLSEADFTFMKDWGLQRDIFPQYTNQQAFLVVVAATWQIVPIFPPMGHYYAGTFGPSGIDGIPTGLHYTSLPRAESTYIYGPSYQPTQQELENEAILCGDGNAQFSDHLSQIKVAVTDATPTMAMHALPSLTPHCHWPTMHSHAGETRQRPP